MRALCLALLFFVSACVPADNATRPRNVLFILVDTLRADHLGVYGYGRDTSPDLDALAREAVLFEDARSQASCTFPSVNSLLTSRYTAVFLGQPDKTMGIPQGVPPLAEVLRGHGYRTAAVSASPVVRRSPSRFNPTGGYDRGFERFHEDCLWKPAECVNRAALEQLNALNTDDGRPFFLYLHYMDPHGPYAPPAGYARRFAIAGDGEPEKEFIRNGNPNPIGDMLYKGAPDPGVTPADLQHLVDLYDDEIAYFDTQLAELLAALREAGRLDDTVLVLASDHGEEFLEHGHIKHCRTLFDTSVKVPLLMKIPGVGASAVPQPVENIDIVPTLLDYLGIDTAGLTLEGESLRPLIEGQGSKDRHQLASQGPWRSIADGRFKLIQDLAAGSFALYDLKADPGETKDVLRRERRSFHELREALTAWLALTEGEAAAGESLRQAEEAEKKLRSLGYLE